jgi:hypothetical protein
LWAQERRKYILAKRVSKYLKRILRKNFDGFEENTVKHFRMQRYKVRKVRQPSQNQQICIHTNKTEVAQEEKVSRCSINKKSNHEKQTNETTTKKLPPKKT